MRCLAQYNETTEEGVCFIPHPPSLQREPPIEEYKAKHADDLKPEQEIRNLLKKSDMGGDTGDFTNPEAHEWLALRAVHETGRLGAHALPDLTAHTQAVPHDAMSNKYLAPGEHAQHTFHGTPRRLLPMLKDMMRFTRPLITWDPFLAPPPLAWPNPLHAAASERFGSGGSTTGATAPPPPGGKAERRQPAEANSVVHQLYPKSVQERADKDLLNERWAMELDAHVDALRDGRFYIVRLPAGGKEEPWMPMGVAQVRREGGAHGTQQFYWFARTGAKNQVWPATVSFKPWMGGGTEQAHDEADVEAAICEITDSSIPKGHTLGGKTGGKTAPITLNSEFRKRLELYARHHNLINDDAVRPAGSKAPHAAPASGGTTSGSPAGKPPPRQKPRAAAPAPAASASAPPKNTPGGANTRALPPKRTPGASAAAGDPPPPKRGRAASAPAPAASASAPPKNTPGGANTRALPPKRTPGASAAAGDPPPPKRGRAASATANVAAASVPAAAAAAPAPPVAAASAAVPQVLRRSATLKRPEGDKDQVTHLRTTATSSTAVRHFFKGLGLVDDTLVVIVQEETVGGVEFALVDDLSESGWGRGWVKAAYLSDFEAYMITPQEASGRPAPPLDVWTASASTADVAAASAPAAAAAAASAPPAAAASAPAPALPPPPAAVPVVGTHHDRAEWERRAASNAVFSGDPAFLAPLNEASPLEMGPADLGRFVLLPIDAYPTLKQPRRKGQTHVGWALRITEVSKTRVWLVEPRQSPTGFSAAAVQAMVLLST